METWITFATDWLAGPQAAALLRAAVKLVAGVGLAILGGRGAAALLANQADTHQQILARRIVYYLILGLFLASALSELGFDLSILLGAAGILTVALGFASQTSASNVISGIFLLGERPFIVGDVIKVNNTVGEVLSIDLLSVKLRTFDNLFVRLPNETMIKSEITNLQRFPIRRYDVQVGVSYSEDIEHVREVLMRVADENPLCLSEPAPLIIFMGYGDSSLNHQFSVWGTTENYLELRNSIPAEIKAAFDEEGIEIPFPQRSLSPSRSAEPFEVRLLQPASAESTPEEVPNGNEDGAEAQGAD